MHPRRMLEPNHMRPRHMIEPNHMHHPQTHNMKTEEDKGIVKAIRDGFPA